MNKFSYLIFAVATFTCTPTFAQYQLIEKNEDGSAMYFNVNLNNVDGVIYTSIYENFAKPRKLKSNEIMSNTTGDIYLSEGATLRLKCKDKTISKVDTSKFPNQNMQGVMVAFEKPLYEEDIKWKSLDKKYSDREPYKSMLSKCNH